MSTYKKTDDGRLRLALNRVVQKKKRRADKIKSLDGKIVELQAMPTPLPECQKIALERHQFDRQQAEADMEHLNQEIEHIREARRQRKGPDAEDEEEEQETNAETGLNTINADDAFLEALGMQPTVIDQQEVQFQAM